jgi:NAD(P)H dehydrogenase (quinone)
VHALVIYAHPETTSLTASTAHRIAEGLIAAGGTAEVADLAGEGFDPRMTAADLAVVRGLGTPPEDVLREQERIERADAIVIVHPVYWWSMPSLLKGWVDRVFTFGWAFGGEDATALARRDVHLVRLGGSSPETYASHGYSEAIRTGVEHGIFEFAGSPVIASHLVHSAPDGVGERADAAVDAVVREVVRSQSELVSA